MAKKPTIQPGLISDTTGSKPADAAPAATPDTDTDDKVVAISVALRESEFKFLQEYADAHGASRGSLMTVIMRRGIRELQAGKLKPKKEKVKFTDLV